MLDRLSTEYNYSFFSRVAEIFQTVVKGFLYPLETMSILLIVFKNGVARVSTVEESNLECDTKCRACLQVLGTQRTGPLSKY